MPLVKFIPASDLTYAWTQESALPGVGGRGLNDDFDFDDGPPDTPKLTGLAILGGKIKTDIALIETKGDAARTKRIARKTRAMSRYFDRCFLKGDAKKNPKKEFDGMYRRIPAAKVITNVVNGGAVDHKKVVELLDMVEGPNTEKTLFMNRTTRRNLSVDVGLRAGGRGVMDVTKQLTEFEGAKIVEVFKDEAEQDILPFTEVTGTSGATCTSITCVRFGSDLPEDGVQAINALGETIRHRGPIDFGSYHADFIHMITNVELFSGNCAARLEGIKATVPT
jgi:hypothetical protein